VIRPTVAKVSLPDTVDKGLGQIIRKALTADLDSRYRTAGEFADYDPPPFLRPFDLAWPFDRW